jgi:hypothetical protein
LTLDRNPGFAQGSIKESASEETECWDKCEEDEEEDQICTNGTDEVDETKYTHANHEIA